MAIFRKNRQTYLNHPIAPAVPRSNAYIGVTIPFNNPNGVFYQSTLNREQLFSNLRNLLLTAKGERYFLPDFGTEIRYILFENITDEDVFIDVPDGFTMPTRSSANHSIQPSVCHSTRIPRVQIQKSVTLHAHAVHTGKDFVTSSDNDICCLNRIDRQHSMKL